MAHIPQLYAFTYTYTYRGYDCICVFPGMQHHIFLIKYLLIGCFVVLLLTHARIQWKAMHICTYVCMWQQCESSDYRLELSMSAILKITFRLIHANNYQWKVCVL